MQMTINHSMLVSVFIVACALLHTGHGASEATTSHLGAAQKALITLIEQGEGDPLLKLSDAHRISFAKDPGFSLNETLRQFSEVSVHLDVEVRLVGFSGDSTAKLMMSDKDLARYLRALRTDMDTVVLEPELSALPVYPEFSYRVTRAPSSMTSQLNSLLGQEMQRLMAQPGRHAGWPLSIPVQTVEDAIRNDAYRDNTAAVTIYILNLSGGPGTESRRYAYSYDSPQGQEQRSSCPGPNWAGSAGRYIWIDVNAHASIYGAGPGQPGNVLPHSLPYVQQYKAGALPRAVMADLAALVWSATLHHVWPPLQHKQLELKQQVVVEVMHMHDMLQAPTNKIKATDIQGALQAVLGDRQALQVHQSWLSMSMCDLCVTSFTASLRMMTARDNEVPLLAAKRTQFLDADVLHGLLQQHGSGIFGAAGAGIRSLPDQLVLPVFVFHTSEEEPLLLTGGRPVVAYSDMIVAVTSKAGTYPTGFLCNHDKQQADAQDITRELLAATLTSVWGVANSSAFYTPATGPGTDYLWSVGATPFTPLATARHLPAPLAALLPRNLALVAVDKMAKRLRSVVAGFRDISKGGHLEVHGGHEQKRQVLTRINVARFKLDQSAAAMSRSQYWEALKIAKSLIHDVIMLEKLALRVSKTLEGKLECGAGPGLLHVWWAPAGSLALVLAVIWLRKKVIRPKLDKAY